MPTITAYQHQPRPLSFEASAHRPFGEAAEEQEMYFKQYGLFVEGVGGYDPYSRTVTPMEFDRDVDCHFYLDSMTGAVEAGLVDDEMWVNQLWRSPDDLDAFLAAFSDFDRRFRTVDRWWQMFSLLSGKVGEKGMATSLGIAVQMVLAAEAQMGEDCSED
jgi:hypothetical protein